MKNHFNFKPLVSLVLIIFVIYMLIDVLGKVLIPFIVALILTYIFNPLVEKLNSRFKISRIIISLVLSLIVFLIFLCIPLIVIPALFIQLKTIVSAIPAMINTMNLKLLTPINSTYGTNFNIDFINLKNLLLVNLTNTYNHYNIFSPLAHNSFIILELLAYIILIPFILFYSIINWHSFINFFDSLTPKSYIQYVHNIFSDIDLMLSAYLRGQISVMVIMALYYSLALHFIGLPSGFIIGAITGLLVFIPYIGILCGLAISLIVTFSSFHGMYQLVFILIAYAVGHLLEGGLVTPYLVGGRIGLNPIMIILALMIFGQLFGLVGVLLALPLSTIAVVLLKHAKLYYMNTKYYNEI
ncbi:MAG: AI-2E family transporter [Burkholderiales bacterium]|nr:AI-2E family transporter [Burkholderiales bacterium]